MVHLASGLNGIENKIEPPEPLSLDITKLTPEIRKEKLIGQLPTNLFYALETTSTNPFVEEILGKQLVDLFLQQKYKEWDEYNSGKQAVTPWEFRQFINYG